MMSCGDQPTTRHQPGFCRIDVQRCLKETPPSSAPVPPEPTPPSSPPETPTPEPTPPPSSPPVIPPSGPPPSSTPPSSPPPSSPPPSSTPPSSIGRRSLNFVYTFPADLPAGSADLRVRDSGGEQTLLTQVGAAGLSVQLDVQVTGTATFVVLVDGQEYDSFER